MSRSVLMVASVAAHGVALLVLGNLKSTDLANAATKIEVFDAKPAEAPPPPPPPPPKPKAEPPKPKPRAQSAEPAPPLATDVSPSPLSNAPDFGLSLSGGVAVAPPAGTAARTVKSARAETRQGPVRAADNLKPPLALGCADPPAKPKVLSLPRPAYTDQARSAGVEGKVRIQLTVDTSGTVTQVRVLAGLGYGLDEAAVQAARQARFEPAVRCGKPESSTFTISMRFTAS